MGDTTWLCLTASSGWSYRLILGKGRIDNRNKSNSNKLFFCLKGQWDRQADIRWERDLEMKEAEWLAAYGWRWWEGPFRVQLKWVAIRVGVAIENMGRVLWPCPES